MMTQNGLIKMEKKLFELLKEYSSVEFEFNSNVRIYHDLNIYGDDASDFLQKYSELFDVDIRNLNFSDYFPFEGDYFLPTLIRLLTFKSPKKYKELTINMLIEAAKSHELSSRTTV